VKRLLLVAGAIVVLVAGGLAAYGLYRRHLGRNIHGSSSVEFVTTQAAPPTPLELRIVPWPMYGRDAERLRSAPGIDVHPPFRSLWVAGGRALLEFPPAIGYGRLYLANASGVLAAYGTRNGRRAWIFPTHRCVAASPAVAKGIVYETFLNRPPCNASNVTDGELVAVRVGHGDLVWRKTIGPSESSPLVANGLVYVGDWRGKVYAFDARTGRLRWTFTTGGRVKGGVALAGNRVYVGSYDHHVYALDARTGRLVWKTGAQERLGSTGEFYATPAVAYGRVYIGGTDGKVYSFGATTGKIRWSHGTGGYVYGSPAVSDGLVYVGSYSHTFSAFDAATGDVRWSFHANGPISGSATVVDGIVYFATLAGRTYGLDARTGKQVWTFPDGKYSPVVADTKRFYLVGYAKLYGFVPRRR
jgi:outer membrane protein assembly factor BamB